MSANQSFWRRQQGRTQISHGLTYIVLLLGSVLFLLPLIWQLLTSLMSGAQTMQYPPVWLPNPPQWQNYVVLFTERGLGTGIINSVFVTTLSIIGTVLSSSLAAYGFARLRMPGKNVIFMLLLSTLMLPSIVLIIPQFMLFQRFQWINTFYPLIVPAFFGNAFYIFLLRQFLISVPRDLEEAAWIDGAGYVRTFFQVAVPMIWPAMIAVAVYTFVATWNDFLTPLIYLSDESKYTLAIALRYLQGSTRSRPETQLAMAASMVAIIPCVLVFLAAQRWFVQGTVITGVKG